MIVVHDKESLEDSIVQFYRDGYTTIGEVDFSSAERLGLIETGPFNMWEIYYCLSPEDKKDLVGILGTLAVTHHTNQQFDDRSYFYLLEKIQTIARAGEKFENILLELFNIVETKTYAGRLVEVEKGGSTWDLHISTMYALSEIDKIHNYPIPATRWESLYHTQPEQYKWNAHHLLTSRDATTAEKLLPDLKGKCTKQQYLYAVFKTITHKHKFQQEGKKEKTWRQVHKELLTHATEEEWKEEPLMQAYKKKFDEKKIFR